MKARYIVNTIVVVIAVVLIYALVKGVGQRTTDYSPDKPPTKPYVIGSVDTAFKRIWPDHKIEIGGIPDPSIRWITCFYSRAKTWWIKGGLWLAEDPSEASVACTKTWPISFSSAIPSVEEVWNESASILFKKIRIVRMYDKASNSLIYMIYSDKLVEWSPKNEISVVALDHVPAMLK